MRRVLDSGGVLAAVAVAAVLALRLRRGGERWARRRVERADIERIVVASGTIEPEQLVDLRPKVRGIVERFLVEAGDRVTSGQVVAEIDKETLEASVREARDRARGRGRSRSEAGSTCAARTICMRAASSRRRRSTGSTRRTRAPRRAWRAHT
jgi:multidrug efflux pump subunit AcrA (membrane-fusion protein)